MLISGRGSNLDALIRAGLDIRLVISDWQEAPGLGIARRAGVPVATVERQAFASRSRFEGVLAELIRAYAPRVVALAGFMHVLGTEFVARHTGRLVNIHPSLLPDFPGLDTHARALAAGVREHGCTVHWVTAKVDAGPVIGQRTVPVLPDDTPATLGARVLAQEHLLYPLVVYKIFAGEMVQPC